MMKEDKQHGHPLCLSEQIENLNGRLERASIKLDAYLAKDRAMLASIERVSNHCEKVLQRLKEDEENNTAAYYYYDNDNENYSQNFVDSSRGSTTSQESSPSSSSSSYTDGSPPLNSSTENNSNRSSSYSSSSRTRSSSARTQSSGLSSPTGKKDFIRNIANVREERLRLMLGDMKRSSKNRGNHSV